MERKSFRFYGFSFMCAVSVFLMSIFNGGTGFSDNPNLGLTILPGVFYFTVNGEIQDGIMLSGLKPAALDLEQTGHWNATLGVDRIDFFDSSQVPGFRFQTYVSGDFVYSGSSPTQGDIPASNFKVYANWDDGLQIGIPPTIGEDDLLQTLSIDTANSGKPSPSDPYSDYYEFNLNFYLPDFRIAFSDMPFNYLVSTNSSRNQGSMNFGRFELDLGVPASGEYTTSLYLIMLDGY